MITKFIHNLVVQLIKICTRKCLADVVRTWRLASNHKALSRCFIALFPTRRHISQEAMSDGLKTSLNA